MTRAARRGPAVTSATLGLVALSTLVLTACTPAQAGAAAIVGQTRITENHVNQAAAEAEQAAATLPDTPENALNTSTFLRENTNRLINSVVLERTCAEEGIVVTQAEVDALLLQAAGGQPPEILAATVAAQLAVPPTELNAFAKDFLLSQKLGQKLVPGTDTAAQTAAARARVAQTAAQLGVTVNPRYGTWDPTQAAIADDLDDLSRPAGAPAPSSSDQPPSDGGN